MKTDPIQDAAHPTGTHETPGAADKRGADDTTSGERRSSTAVIRPSARLMPNSCSPASRTPRRPSAEAGSIGVAIRA